MRPALLAAAALAGLLASRAAAAPASVSFEVDARVELLSVVLMLSEPSEFKSRRPDGPDAYAAAATAAFAGFSGHPAVARVAGLRRGGAPASTLARAVLSTAKGDALTGDLRDFAKASRFDAFFEAQKAAHTAFAAAARRESLRAISPEAALAYMGRPFTGRHRFILAPLLPADDGAEALRLRPGAPAPGAIRFGFDTFEGSVAAVLCREAVTWPRPPAGDIPAHIAAAVGLRVLALDLGEGIYGVALRRHASGRVPHLESFSARLKEYEAERDRHPTLRSFYPRFEAAAAIRVSQAERAARDGARAQALVLLAEARAQNPDLETRRRMVFLYQDLEEEREAKSLSDELLAAAPEHSGVLLDRAASAAKAGERKAALGLLSAALKHAPDEDARRRIAALYLELKEFGPAGGLLDALITAEPREARPLIDRALVAARTGDRPAALHLLERAGSLRPGSEERRRMALLYLEVKEHAPAQALLDALIKERPADASLRVDRAAVDASAGKRDAALRQLAEARGLGPDPDARRRMAVLYESLGAGGEALDLLDELLRNSPESARQRLERASLAARSGAREAALAHLAEARRLNPSQEERRLLAARYRELREPAQAKSLLAGLVAAAPRDPGLRVELAALAAEAGERDAALRLLAEAGQLSPEPGDRQRMALLHQGLKDYAGALLLLEPLAREQPENAALRGDLGLCKYLAGRTDEAIADLGAAIKLDPSSLQAVLTLGSIHEARDRFDLALSVYDAAPPGAGAPELRALLTQSRREALRRSRAAAP